MGTGSSYLQAIPLIIYFYGEVAGLKKNRFQSQRSLGLQAGKKFFSSFKQGLESRYQTFTKPS